MAQRTLALVLGGGGAAGNAWLIGVIAGLAEAGLDLTRTADLVIGTSAGATAAAQVRSGLPPADLLASILSAPARPAGAPPLSLPPDRVFDRMRAIAASAASPADLQRAMGAFGLESDAGFPPEAGEQRRAMVAARLPRADWPERPMILAAIDALTGELVRLDRDCGALLADAVTAATALPGTVPTHAINGRQHINGGVRSPDNADLAAGHDDVIVLSPLSGQTGPRPEGQFEGLRRPPEWGMDLESQVEALRRQGSRVWVITPDPESRVAMGVNQMDLATRIPSARAGFAQGRREAPRPHFS